MSAFSVDVDDVVAVGVVHGFGEAGREVARGGGVDAVLPVEHHLDAVDALVVRALQAVEHVQVHRVVVQGQDVRGRVEGQAVVALDGLVAGDAREDRLAAAGVPGEVVRLHRVQQHQVLGLGDARG